MLAVDHENIHAAIGKDLCSDIACSLAPGSNEFLSFLYTVFYWIIVLLKHFQVLLS